MTKRKRTNKNLQNTTQKTKARPTRIPLKTGGELKCSGRVDNSCSSSCTLRVAVYQIFIYLGVASEYIDIANPSFLLGKLMGTSFATRIKHTIGPMGRLMFGAYHVLCT